MPGGEADAILNICGTQEFNEDLLASDRILYIESDPGVEQIKVDQRVRSTIKYLRRHHALFTFGENVGSDAFPVPAHKLKWLPTRQPIVLDWFPRATDAARDVFTTVMNWVSYTGCEYAGEPWGQKDVEFLKFVDLPQCTTQKFEIAMGMGPGMKRPTERLEQTGWHQGKASEILGISPSTLYRQLKSYGLTRSRRLHEQAF